MILHEKQKLSKKFFFCVSRPEREDVDDGDVDDDDDDDVK